MVYRTAPFSMTLTDPNPHFKVRPFFDAEYLRNGCRYSHSYYGRRIGNRTEAFKRYHFQWPWVTTNPHFKIFSVKEWRDLENQVRGRSRSFKMAPFDRSYATFYWSAIVPFSSYLTLNNIVTLKSGLEVTQGHWNWCHSKAWVRFQICLL